MDATLPLAAALVAAACRNWVPVPILLLWVGAITLICVALGIVGQRIDPMLQNGEEDVRHVARVRTAMTALFMVTWCAMSVLLWVPANPLNHILIILFLACGLAGSSSILAAHPASAAVTLAAHGAALVVRPALAGDPLDLILAGLSLLFWLIMAGQVRTIYLTAKRARELEFERQAIIHDLGKAKAESDRDRANAIKAGRAKSEFLSNMNHELRTPMNAILGFSELIKSKAFGDAVDKYVEYAEIIHDSGQHLLSLINDMMDLARIEGGRLTLQESEFSAVRLLADMVEEQQEAAANGKLTLTMNPAPGLPSVRGDQRALRQIVINLLSNAIKFTPPGGHITVSAATEPDGRFAMSVEDTGIGIRPEDQLYLFERFGRGPHDVTNADRGTGLGLAIVKGFAEAHDGTVALTSVLGTGTRVTVHLPAERVLPTVAPQPPKAR